MLLLAFMAFQGTTGGGSALPGEQITQSYVCEADVIHQGFHDSQHRGGTLSAGQWGGGAGVDVLSGSLLKWDEFDIDGGTKKLCSIAIHLDVGTQGACVGRADVYVQADQAGDLFGRSAVFIGDLDGDGLDDIAAGAPRWSCPPVEEGVPLICEQTGRVYIFLSSHFPAHTGGFQEVSAGAAASMIITGSGVGDRFGYSLSTAGTFFRANHYTAEQPECEVAKLPDLLIGAPGNPALDMEGIAYVVDGNEIYGRVCEHTGSLPVVVSIDDLDAWSDCGEFPKDAFGYSVAFVGKVDGVRDHIAIGAPETVAYDSGLSGSGDEGYVSVYPWAVGGPPAVAFTLRGVEPGEGFGTSVGGDFDVNLDGWSDLVVGSPFRSKDGLLTVGAAYVFDGATATVVHTARGAQSNERFGRSVAALSDMDLDGRDDWIVGSVNYSLPVDTDACLNAQSTVCFTDSQTYWPDDPDAGDNLCGRAVLKRGSNGRTMHSYFGEDFRDSAGWAFVDVGQLGGSLKPDLLLSAPRFAPYPDLQDCIDDWGVGACPTGPTLKEVGRIYLFYR